MGRSGDHKRVIVSEDEKIAQAADVTQFYIMPAEDYTVVQVLCRQLGETDIRLMISNSPVVANCKSQTSTVTTRVICGKPRRIVLQPELQIADENACPMDLSSGNVAVQSSANIDIEVNVYDDCGMRFLNISSLNLDWSVSPINMGTISNKDGTFPKNITVGNVPVAFKHYQTLTPNVEVGTLLLNVTVRGYKAQHMKAYRITPESPPFTSEEDKSKALNPVEASLQLFLVDEIVITPNVITMFNHPGNKEIVSVKQGSGYFELALSTDDVALIKYCEKSRTIEIIPLHSGELTVQVIDLCLVARPATLIVNVVSVGIIRVDMVDKVEVGKCISSIVRIYDENDNLMAVPDPGMIDLQPEFENKIANIQRDDINPDQPWGLGEIHFTITGTIYRFNQ